MKKKYNGKNLMVNIDIEYLGDLMCQITHTPSGNKFLTDAPLDNNGQARFISPTDLLAASIGSCVATIMGIKCKNAGIDLSGLKISVAKNMINDPIRRVSELNMTITFGRVYEKSIDDMLRNVVKTCPVTKSLLPEIKLNYLFEYPEQ